MEDLKNMISPILQLPFDSQRIIFVGKQLEDGRTTADYSIQGKPHNETLRLAYFHCARASC